MPRRLEDTFNYPLCAQPNSRMHYTVAHALTLGGVECGYELFAFAEDVRLHLLVAHAHAFV